MKATELSEILPTPLQVEDESFWQQHCEAHQESGLTRRAYCRINSIDYYRFGYWLKKWSKQNVKLIPVKLKSTDNNSSSYELCTLRLHSGHEIKINDARALSLILEKLA